MPDDFFDIKNRPPTVLDKECEACGITFTPRGFWEHRCTICRETGTPRLKVLQNPKFEGIKAVPDTHRHYSAGNGKKYPSVTTILHPEGIDFPIELLTQYASRGKLIHKKIEHHIKHGKYPTLEELYKIYPEETGADIMIMKNGSLGLKHTQCNWPGFYGQYGHDFTFDEIEIKLVSHEHEYAGTTDCIGTYKGSPAILDWKTASAYDNKKLDSYYMQLSAYAKACGADIKHLVIVPLSPKSVHGYLAPFITDKVDHYFNQFLIKRKEYREKYGR